MTDIVNFKLLVTEFCCLTFNSVGRCTKSLFDQGEPRGGSSKLFIKGQAVSTLSFAGYMVSMLTNELCLNTKASTDNM